MRILVGALPGSQDDHPRRAPRPARPRQSQQNRRAVVAAVALGDRAGRVRPVHEAVAAGRQAGHVDVLALEVGRVVVAPAGRDPDEQLEQPPLAEAAAAGVRRPRLVAGEAGRAADAVAVAEAEAGLAVAPDRPRAAAAAQLVALEADVVPVPVVAVHDVAHGADAADAARRAVAA